MLKDSNSENSAEEEIEKKAPKQEDKKTLLQEKLKKLLMGRESNNNDYNFNHTRHYIPNHLEYNSDATETSEKNDSRKQSDNMNIISDKKVVEKNSDKKESENKENKPENQIPKNKNVKQFDLGDEQKEKEIDSSEYKRRNRFKMNVVNNLKENVEENKTIQRKLSEEILIENNEKNQRKKLDNEDEKKEIEDEELEKKEKRNKLLKLLLSKKKDNKIKDEEEQKEQKKDIKEKDNERKNNKKNEIIEENNNSLRYLKNKKYEFKEEDKEMSESEEKTKVYNKSKKEINESEEETNIYNKSKKEINEKKEETKYYTLNQEKNNEYKEYKEPIKDFNDNKKEINEIKERINLRYGKKENKIIENDNNQEEAEQENKRYKKNKGREYVIKKNNKAININNDIDDKENEDDHRSKKSKKEEKKIDKEDYTKKFRGSSMQKNEGAMKILELLKAKKNEKSEIEQKEKEAKNEMFQKIPIENKNIENSKNNEFNIKEKNKNIENNKNDEFNIVEENKNIENNKDKKDEEININVENKNTENKKTDEFNKTLENHKNIKINKNIENNSKVIPPRRGVIDIPQKPKNQDKSVDYIYSSHIRKNSATGNFSNTNKENKNLNEQTFYKKVASNNSPLIRGNKEEENRRKKLEKELKNENKNNNDYNYNLCQTQNITKNTIPTNDRMFTEVIFPTNSSKNFSAQNNNLNNLYFQEPYNQNYNLYSTKKESTNIFINNYDQTNPNKFFLNKDNPATINSPRIIPGGSPGRIYAKKKATIVKGKSQKRIPSTSFRNNNQSNDFSQKASTINPLNIAYTKKNSIGLNNCNRSFGNIESINYDSTPFYMNSSTNNIIYNNNSSFDGCSFQWNTPCQGQINDNSYFTKTLVKPNQNKVYSINTYKKRQIFDEMSNSYSNNFNNNSNLNNTNYINENNLSNKKNYNYYNPKFNSINVNNNNHNNNYYIYSNTTRSAGNEKVNYNYSTNINNQINNNNQTSYSNNGIQIINYNNRNKPKPSFTVSVCDLVVIEDKLSEIISVINDIISKTVSNECYDLWNFYYNSIYYQNIETFLKDSENYETVKLSINYILMSVMICYDFSFDSDQSFNIHLLLTEIFSLNYKNLILIFENILTRINPESNDDIWINKLYEIVNYSKFNDNSSYLMNEKQFNNNEKMIFNTNSLKAKIQDLLTNYQSKSTVCLLTLFSKLSTKTVEDINDFFREYIIREDYLERSILATTYLNNDTYFTTENIPYVRNKNPKKFTLVLDFDETLAFFKIDSEMETDGVLRLRPDVFTFLNEMKKYYELILFSEATQNYVDLLLESFEETQKYFDHKLYRQHTVIAAQDFVKDLTRIGRPLDSIIIIDNSPQNFRLQVKNGIAIKSFWGEDSTDNALKDLIPILVDIAKNEEDVRKGLDRYHNLIVSQITSNLYKHSHTKNYN